MAEFGTTPSFEGCKANGGFRQKRLIAEPPAPPPPGKEDASEYRQVGRLFANLCSLRAPTVAFSSLSQNQITPLTSLGADPSGRSRSW